ncbi:helicase HerA-like domain-containing protein [Sphingomonas sanxanigenens]|uniref:helicase HerA-like domain-containing protein n=1 Tax=Sphingomonas sanxanigenens TaxID=397260 RepID=UPI00046CDF6D|nr:helicase HerA-like domain-containing protein [Sphingomonas sanxanigenens]
MADAEGVFVGVGGGNRQILNFRRANRHGLIAGATGTGKTVTLQGLVEGFSGAGVPVFVADVKGDLSGLAMAGSPTAKVHDGFATRAAEIGYSDWRYADNPVQFWDLFGEQGPVRTTVSEMGPLLLSRLMDLNDTQEGVLTIAFHVADRDGLLLLDLDDLQAMLAHCAERAAELTTTYGNVSKATVGTIQRALLQLRSQGGDHFFGEPALDIADLIARDDKGRGIVNILAADKLMASPKLYSTFLLWLLSELFETLPEVGDPDKPKLCFFFDEAHLLFDDAPKALLDKIEQVVRLIRSKGVGVYFITQNPVDIPETVAGQLGNRVQHALRAFTPKDQKAIRAAAETFRANPGVDAATAITELKVGEALVSLLQADGSPSPVERTLIKPVASRVGPVTPVERGVIRETDAIGTKYDEAIDRESAEELLTAKAAEASAAVAEARAAAEQARLDAAQAKEDEKARVAAEREAAKAAKEAERARQAQERDAAREAARRAKEAARPSLAETMVQSAARSAASSIGRKVAGNFGAQLMRGLLGGLFKGR